MYVLHDKSPHSEATVDDITLVPGGDPVELTDNQVKRLDDAGVKVKAFTDSADMALEDLPLDTLKSMATERGLAVSGTKAELIERIHAHDDNEGVN